MASVGRESHRSPTAAGPEDGKAGGPRADAGSIIAGGGKPPAGVGAAGLEVDVGNVDVLFGAQSGQKKRSNNTKAAKKLSKGGGPRGRGKTKSPLGGRSTSPSPTENATTATITTAAEPAAALVGGEGQGGGAGGGEGGGEETEGVEEGPREGSKVHAAPNDAAAAEGVEGRGDIVDKVAATAVGSSSKGSTRERSQQMYESYRQTQV